MYTVDLCSLTSKSLPIPSLVSFDMFIGLLSSICHFVDLCSLTSKSLPIPSLVSFDKFIGLSSSICHFVDLSVGNHTSSHIHVYMCIYVRVYV